jgi:hypothetical protein
VGPGTLTPQRRMTRDGSPQAAVAWLFVFRRRASPIASGNATIMGAQAGSAASLAAVTSTAGEHPANEETMNAAARAVRIFVMRPGCGLDRKMGMTTIISGHRATRQSTRVPGCGGLCTNLRRTLPSARLDNLPADRAIS